MRIEQEQSCGVAIICHSTKDLNVDLQAEDDPKWPRRYRVDTERVEKYDGSHGQYCRDHRRDEYKRL